MNRFLNILKLCQHDSLTCGLRKGQESMTPRLLSWANKWMHGHLLKWRRLRAQPILVMKYQKFCLGYVVWDAYQTINCTDQAASWVCLEITGYRYSEIKELVKCNPEKLVELNPSLDPNWNWLSIGHKNQVQQENLSAVGIFFCHIFLTLQSIPCHSSPISSLFLLINRVDGGGLVVKSCLTLATPCTVACQALLSMGFSRQEYWSGLPFSSLEDLPNPVIELKSPALQADSLPTINMIRPWVTLTLSLAVRLTILPRSQWGNNGVTWSYEGSS